MTSIQRLTSDGGGVQRAKLGQRSKLGQRTESRWRLALVVSLAASGVAWAPSSDAAVVFSNGFESNDLLGWNTLNVDGLTVVSAPEPVLAGTYALRAELTTETVWENGIFRTEVQHKPDEARAADGAELYFGWSVYLPKALPAGDYQLGYFETRNTYQQVFSLHAKGSDLALYVNRESPTSPSHHPGVLEVGKWHRIVYHVKWSSDSAAGFVSLWWDGVKLVDKMAGRTYLNDPALVQLGLLNNLAPPEPVVLYVDEVIEGDSYADVSFGIPEGGAEPAPGDTSGIAPTDPAPTDPAPTDPVPTDPASTDPAPTDPAPTGPVPPTDPAPTGPAPTDPAPTDPAPAPTDPAGTAPLPGATTEPAPPAAATDAKESGCSVSRVNSASNAAAWLMGLTLVAWRRRRAR